MNLTPFCALAAAGLLNTAIALAADDAMDLLPPVQPWAGKSPELIVAADDPWITPAERSGLTATPRYAETVDWLRKLVAAAPELEMVSIGRSLQGRDVWMVIASKGGAFTPQAMRAAGKPVLLAQAGIHGGEIDGKDAGLMLLRDMTVAHKRADLLDAAIFLFIPILNVDGHERFSRFNRMNQRGPAEMGWRTNARNQNLNRDYTKLDTREIQAVVKTINNWQPDLYLDLHVTDGADYQYDITFGGNGRNGWSPAVARWIDAVYTPEVGDGLRAMGHVPGPLIFAVNGMDMEDGFRVFTGSPRYSNGYGDARHLPTILVENHSLKPYRQRVLGTYVLLAATLETLGRNPSALRAAVAEDRARRPDPVPLRFATPDAPPNERYAFKGIASERYQGKVSGGTVVRWTGKPVEEELPVVYDSQVAASATRPAAYLVPPEWSDIAARLRAHGIEVERLEQATALDAEVTRLPDAAMAEPAPWTPNPFEGHVRMNPGKPVKQSERVTVPPGSFRVDTDQPLGDLAVLLLEPTSPDSFFQWGWFLEVFTRTEYFEPYVMEPLAERMMREDPALRAEFEARLAADPEFAADPNARLRWFYERSPYYDQSYRRYPVLRVLNKAAAEHP